jgi:hypothetical protein
MRADSVKKSAKQGGPFSVSLVRSKDLSLVLTDKAPCAEQSNESLTKLKLDRFNGLEITQIEAKRFLGLPYVTVCAHSRHYPREHVPFARQGSSGLGPSKIGVGLICKGTEEVQDGGKRK